VKDESAPIVEQTAGQPFDIEFKSSDDLDFAQSQNYSIHKALSLRKF
jgi:hypothetical protein